MAERRSAPGNHPRASASEPCVSCAYRGRLEERIQVQLEKKFPVKADGVPVLEPALEIMRMTLSDVEAYAEYVTMLHDDPLPPNIARCLRPLRSHALFASLRMSDRMPHDALFLTGAETSRPRATCHP